MSPFRVSILTAAIALAGLAACSNGQPEAEVSQTTDVATAMNAEPSSTTPDPAAPTTPAEVSAPTAGAMAGSWAFVAGSIYAGGEACGFEQAELDSYKAKARGKVEAMGDGTGFDAAFAQGVKTGQADMAGGAPDARTCELTRDAFSRG
ncbi:hypothetical protein [Lysobacter sp. F60174L2]|uniref:hypothetical protein n=1 Tax=Lysobacter sp. F60174L2 TaxID=3459295 RepID=UPI00403DD9DB